MQVGGCFVYRLPVSKELTTSDAITYFMANHPPPGHYPIRLEDVFNEEEIEEIRRSELTFLEAALSRWLNTPDAPICKINPNPGETRNRSYTTEEIQRMKDDLKRLAPATYERLFRDGS
jgi:hypothetical protein